MMIEKLNCMKIMEFKSEHWLMVLCWGELDNEKKNLRRNGTEFTQKCFDIVSLVSMDCFLIVNIIIIFQVSREYLLWKERFQWFCTTITTTTILYVFSENSWIKTITTTKIELKLYKKHITLSAEHKNANVFCTAYEFISLFLKGMDGLISFMQTKIFHSLTISQTTNFRRFQTERNSRQQFQIRLKWQKVLQVDKKHCGKSRNCLLRANSSFPAVFSKDLCCRHLKTRACLG